MILENVNNNVGELVDNYDNESSDDDNDDDDVEKDEEDGEEEEHLSPANPPIV
ncbi:hypothetical protein Tco_1495621, partial [Tanacetum coccineum]